MLHAGPSAGVRVPSRTIGVDRDPAVLMHSLLMNVYASMEFLRQLTWKSGIAWRSGSKATQIQAGVPPRFTMVPSTNILRTSLGSAPMDPRLGRASAPTSTSRRGSC